MSELIFWLAILLALYSYFLYPLILLLIRRPSSSSNGRETAKVGSPSPSLTMIITVHNESLRIREKIENSLAIQYDGKLEILVASDHSTDDTDDIVRSFSDKGVKLIRANKRLGKEYAQWCAIQEAAGEVLVFSDVATKIPEDSLQKMAAYFADDSVGAVSSEDRFISQDGSIAGEGAYVRYEMWLRSIESDLAGLIGLSGSFFAARKSVCQDWDIESPSDFNTALNCASCGLKGVTAPDVLGYYQDLKDSKQEYRRKVRTVLRGMTALMRHPKVLNPWRFGLFALQIWSHKVMRWLVPWFLIAAFTANCYAAASGFIYQLTMLGQISFYCLAIGAHFQPKLLQLSPVKIIYFFVQVNVALAESLLRLLSGKRMTTWQPSAR